MKKYIEIFASYLSYKNDEGKDTRSKIEFMGSVKDLVLALKDVPLDRFDIHFYNDADPLEFVNLANQIVECHKLSKPYIYAGSMY